MSPTVSNRTKPIRILRVSHAKHLVLSRRPFRSDPNPTKFLKSPMQNVEFRDTDRFELHKAQLNFDDLPCKMFGCESANRSCQNQTQPSFDNLSYKTLGFGSPPISNRTKPNRFFGISHLKRMVSNHRPTRTEQSPTEFVKFPMQDAWC